MTVRSIDRSVRASRINFSTRPIENAKGDLSLGGRTGVGRAQKYSGCGITRAAALFASVALLALSAPAFANGFGESSPWQFETTNDMVNRGYIADLIERKKGGYFDSFSNNFVTNNTTYIDTQVNCNVSSTALGNSGSNAMEAYASSPNINNDATITATTVGNEAVNDTQDRYGPGGVVLANNTANDVNPGGGLINNDQTNDGSTLTSDVTGSSTTTTSGAVSADNGQTNQVLNSAQDNLGNQTSTISDSTACNLESGAVSSGPIN